MPYLKIVPFFFSVKFLRTVSLSLKVRINGVQALRIQ